MTRRRERGTVERRSSTCAEAGLRLHATKCSSLERRIHKRMGEVGIADYGDYQDHLEVKPGRVHRALQHDPDQRHELLPRPAGLGRTCATEVVPAAARGVPDDEPIRVWSAGCASGEEAYTIAMVLAEALGEEAFQRRVKIYATDVDEDALTTRAPARLPDEGLKAVPDELVERYFEPSPARPRVPARPAPLGHLRPQRPGAGRADLAHRPAALPQRPHVLHARDAGAGSSRRFNFALQRPTGFLFLGKSEMLLTPRRPVRAVEPQVAGLPEVAAAQPRASGSRSSTAGGADADGADRQRRAARGGASTLAPVAQIVIDADGAGRWPTTARAELFALGAADLGRPLQDLELSYRPLELRSALERAYERRRRRARAGSRGAHGRRRATMLEVDGHAGPRRRTATRGATVTVRGRHRLRAPGRGARRRPKRELETAYEELQSTVEELETTNEELQSTNEELETTNEELQSTNEELETMNEELQSTNDELETMNDEQRRAHGRARPGQPVPRGHPRQPRRRRGVVVDREQHVQVWNVDVRGPLGAARRRGRGDGLPVARHRPADHRARTFDRLGARRRELDEAVQISAVTRRGRPMDCAVRILR